MSKLMTAEALVKKCLDIAENYKTLYVMGCFGSPMTAANKKRFCDNHAFNRAQERRAMINAAGGDTFGFDCVNLIKAILWGWRGDKSHIYGGAKYASCGVPDVSADGMIKLCDNVGADFTNIAVGEAVWTDGHIGVYIGGGLAVECTPKWDNCVQVTAVGNIGKKSGYNTRTWKKHGKLPWVEYSQPKAKTKAEEINDLVWELAERGIVTDKALWLKKAESDVNVYWLMKKAVSFLRSVKG